MALTGNYSKSLEVVFDTDEIYESMDRILSGLLPHENYDEDIAFKVVREVEKLIELNEMKHVYHVLFKALKNKLLIKTISPSSSIALTIDDFQRPLEINIRDLMRKPEIGVEEFLRTYEQPSDLNIQEHLENGADFFYTACLDKYADLFEMAIPSDQSFSELNVLESVLRQNLSTQAIAMMAEILTAGYTLGREFYQGPKDLQKFVATVFPEIDARFVSFMKTKSEQASFTSMEDVTEFDNETTGTIRKLFTFGYKPLESIPMETKTILTIVGDEGTGKTQMMVEQAWRAMMAGNDVLIMAGESPMEKIFNMVVARHVKFAYKKQVNWKEIQSPDESVPTQILEIAKLAKMDLVSNEKFGKLHIVQSFSYETFKNEIEDWVNKFPNITTVFVDHTDQLDSTGAWTEDARLSNQREKVGYLYKQAKKLKKEKELGLVFFAHPNTDAAKASASGKEEKAGIRIGANSSAISKDSDMVFHMTKATDNEVQKMIKIRIAKMREYGGTIRPFIMKLNGVCSEYIYKDEYQAGYGETEGNVEEMY